MVFYVNVCLCMCMCDSIFVCEVACNNVLCDFIVCLSVCVNICFSICLSVCMQKWFMWLYVCSFVQLSVSKRDCLFVCKCQLVLVNVIVYLCVCVNECEWTWLSVCVYVWMSVSELDCLFVCMCDSIFVCVFACQLLHFFWLHVC